MADDTDTTRPGETAAVEAVMPYLCVSGSAEHCGAHRAVCVAAAEAIVDAVYPVIAAAVREQAAEDIGRDYIAGSRPGVYSVSQHNDDVLSHQRIVRGGR